ncbi:MAG TPA: OsmC family protein [Candidatus Aminicenantes bacterium]|nr:OsmC family protein [Candidatus Aminicenantes bacterium]HRY64660.1 OsmC family protein [Candidatus Aminicenantes bacterium]HRZ71573.1 OsmC family protein [Candidatus Aminicenantes bacterium]
MTPHELKVAFGDNYRIDVAFKGFTIRTGQPVGDGGDGSAPSPFDLFLSSLAACAGYYALAFCQERQLQTEGLGLTMTAERGEVSKMIDRIVFTVDLPRGFPEKYRFALTKAIDHCTVKSHILRPPQFEIVVRP